MKREEEEMIKITIKVKRDFKNSRVKITCVEIKRFFMRLKRE